MVTMDVQVRCLCGRGNVTGNTEAVAARRLGRSFRELGGREESDIRGLLEGTEAK